MKIRLLRRLLPAFGMAALLGACGGGGSSDSGDKVAPPDNSNSGGNPAQAPYTGAPAAIPGSIEAENFDIGGEGVAYHDKDGGNSGAVYRPDEDVDIAETADAGGEYDIQDFRTGEWLSYSVDVIESGDYTIELRVSSAQSGSAFNIQIDGEDVSGTVDIPGTGNADSYIWTGSANVALAAGTHTLTVQSEREYFNLNSIRVSKTPDAGPYLGMPHAVPGTFQAEDFDLGGEGAAYHDLSSGNSGNAYRSGEDVDIAPSTDPQGGAYVVDDIESGEWLSYTIDVAETGEFDMALRVASESGDSAFHVEIDGQDVSNTVAVPDTGGADSFDWVGITNISLDGGEHEMRIVAERQYFRLNEARIEKPPPPPADGSTESTPYSGKPAPVPGTIAAEDFDLGGQGVAYNDTDTGNAGGAYRPDEDVDIVATGDADGGFDVNKFNTGEWLSYTIDVAESRDYDIEVRAASAFSDSAFRIEIDGRDVTGGISVPNTGNWTAFEWVAARDVSLSAGRHVMTIIADRQFFNLNSIRISEQAPAPSPPPPSDSATLLFSSGFDGATTLPPPVDCWGRGCWQSIAGLDSITNFSWPSTLWNGTSRFLLLTDPVTTTPLTIGNYTFNRIESMSGPRGNASNALFQQITKNVNGTAPMGTSPAQNELEFQPKTDVNDLYVSFWIKLQPDLVEKMNNLPSGPGISGGGTWRAFFAMKTGNQTAWGDPAGDGDYRIEAYVMTYGGGQPYWAINGDNTAGGGAPLVNNFSVQNRDVPVPVGKWFKFEVFWHRSNSSDGRVWMAVDGQVVADRRGPNRGAWDMPVNRIMAPLLYSGGRMPVYQWIDNIEIWDGFPPSGNNPPYAAH